MSQRAVDFVHMWISANVHPNGFIDERHDTRPKEYAVKCWKHAGLCGISAAEIKESCGDLEDVMAAAIEKWPIGKPGTQPEKTTRSKDKKVGNNTIHPQEISRYGFAQND